MELCGLGRNLGVNDAGYRPNNAAYTGDDRWMAVVSIDSGDKGATTDQSNNAKGDHRDRR